MKNNRLYSQLFISILFLISFQGLHAQLAGTWQHTETGAQIRFENQSYQNYDHIGYYASPGNLGANFYVGEDILYLTSQGNNQYSGYLKGKNNLTEIIWIADTWSINGNNAYSSAKGNFVKITGYNTYPDIAGTWYVNSDPNEPAYVTQNGQYLAFQVGEHQSQGYFTSNTDMFASSWNAVSTLSSDYRTINWGNQTWTKSVISGPTNYPSIAGTWYVEGNANQTAIINQNGQYLSFAVATHSSQGYFNSVRELFASDWNTTASLSGDGNTITWGNQKWTRNPGKTPNPGGNTVNINPNSYYKISAKHSGKVLDVYGGSKNDGANVYQHGWHGGDNQLWKIERQSDGYYRIISKNSGKVLDVAGNSKSNSANIYQYNWHGGDNQRWHIEVQTNGHYKITAKHSGKAFDIEGASKANSANLKQYDWHGGDNQQWKFEVISGGTGINTGREIETVKVLGASREKVYSSNVLQSGKTYTLQISGTFNVWNTTDPTGIDALYCYQPNECSPPKLWSPLHIDDKALVEYFKSAGASYPYEPNHTYQVTITGTGSRLGLGLKDGGVYGGGNNCGEVYVKIIAN